MPRRIIPKKTRPAAKIKIKK